MFPPPVEPSGADHFGYPGPARLCTEGRASLLRKRSATFGSTTIQVQPGFSALRIRADKIDTAKGERWFCDEAEAIAADWRPARSR